MTDLHEIIHVEGHGRKYEQDFPIELCVLLCGVCNQRIGGGRAYIPQLLAYNADEERFGHQAVIAALMQVQAKYPAAWLPLTLEVGGHTYQILP